MGDRVLIVTTTHDMDLLVDLLGEKIDMEKERVGKARQSVDLPTDHDYPSRS